MDGTIVLTLTRQSSGGEESCLSTMSKSDLIVYEIMKTHACCIDTATVKYQSVDGKFYTINLISRKGSRKMFFLEYTQLLECLNAIQSL